MKTKPKPHVQPPPVAVPAGLADGDRLRPAQVAAKLNVSVRTVERWMFKGIGVRGRKGNVRLNSILIGGHRRISPEDVEAFILACNPGVGESPTPTPGSSGRVERERDRRAAAADAELREMGLID